MPNTVRKSRLSGKGADAESNALDRIDRSLLDELQHDARITYAELARRVHLSKPAVMERVRKLERSGIIRGYRAMLDPVKMGLHILAIVKVIVAGDRLLSFAKSTHNIPEVMECHRVTGSESFIVQVVVRDMNHLETVIDAMMPYVSTNTSIVLNSPVYNAPVPIPSPPARRATKRSA